MSDFEYNGIALDLIRTERYEETPVMNGPDYLYTLFDIGVTGYYSPKATSYEDDPAGARKSPGLMPAVTDRAIRARLQQARGYLRYDQSPGQGSGLVLESPAIDPETGLAFKCDDNNGPEVVSFSVNEVISHKTWLISFQVRTWLRLQKCPTDTTDRKTALISNRFEQSGQIDDQFFETRTTTGQAFFRTSILEKFGDTADAFRRLCLPKIPRGFQRTSIAVTAVPSRNALSYVVTDREKPFDLGDQDVRRGGYGVTDCQAEYIVSSATAQSGDGVGGIATGGVHAQVNVSVKGDKLSSTNSLTQFAIMVVLNRLPIGDISRGWLQNFQARQSLTSREVSISATMYLGPKGGANQAPFLNDQALFQGPVFGDRGGVNPTPPGASVRGPADLLLMTQELATACGGVPSLRSAVKANDVGGFAGQPLANLPAPSVGGVVARAQAAAGVIGPIVGPVITPGFATTVVPPGNGTDPDSPLPAVSLEFSPTLPAFPNLISVEASQEGGIYQEYKVDAMFMRQHHKLQCPVAGPPGTPSLILTAARPTGQVKYVWTAERINKRPRIPLPQSLDPNQVLVSDWISPVAPEVLNDGISVVYRVSGEYVYLLRNPVGAGDRLPMGAVPWSSISFNDSYIELSDYQSGITGPAAATGGG